MEEPVHVLTPNREHMREHLVMLFGRCPEEYPDGLIEVRPIKFLPGGRGVKVDHNYSNVNNIEDAIEYAVERNKAGWNIYVGPNPRKPGTPPFGPASGDDVEIAFFQFADADTPDAADAIKHTPLDYTFAVTTGRTPNVRPHVYWELEEPTRNMKAWRQQQANIADAFGSDRVIDPPRIMRLAGTINYPSEKKSAKGYVTELTTIRTLYNDESREPVTSESLWHAFPQKNATGVLPPTQDGSPTTTPTGSLHLTDQNGIDPRQCIAAINGGDNLHNNTRDLIAHLVGAGYPNWFIHELTERVLSPVSDGGTTQQIPNLIQTARDKFNVADPGLDTVALMMNTELDPGPRCATTFVGAAPDRQWVVEDWIIEGATNALYGGGGTGKTLLAQMLGTAAAIGGEWLGMPVKKQIVLAVLCEDEYDELHRRQNAINKHMGVDPHHLKDLHLWSRVSHDNLLATFDGHEPTLKPFHNNIIAQALEVGATFIILDTIADLFGGNEIDRAQVNWFVKTGIGSIVKATGATVLQLAHPSLAGMASGSGTSGSTAWENAVRSRMYLERPKDGLPEERIISRKKSNYASSGEDTATLLYYEHGVLVSMDKDYSAVEYATCLRNVVMEVKEAYDNKRPIKKQRGAHSLETHMMDYADKTHVERKSMAKALSYAKAMDLIIPTPKGSHKLRGWMVSYEGEAWLQDNGYGAQLDD